MSGLRRLRRDLSGRSYFRGLTVFFRPRRSRPRARRGLPFNGIKFGAALVLLFAGQTVRGGDFPVISRLDPRDPVFKQYLDDVELARRRIHGRKESPRNLAETLGVYAYELSENDDIFRLAARCNVPYAALATLNRIDHPSSLPKTVLLPSVPGIFLAETPLNDLEQLMASSRDPSEGITVTVRRGEAAERFCFLPGADFNPTERACFLNTGFGFPLKNYRITSSFGRRPSPFTGRPQNHSGLDLAAPAGTDVFATRAGTVAETGEDSVYGRYVVIAHDNNWVSLYGHLSAIRARTGGRVGRDSVIGLVGSTGQSTGPHLHFEIRKNGAAMDPGKLLFRRN